MRVIRLKMYQEMARFNNPSAPRGADCYPLPPFSTVNGFIHSMCQWKKYHKLDYFVTGKGVYNTKTQKEWHGGKRFNKVSDEMLKRWDIITDYTDGSHTGWVNTVKYHLMLVDLYTTIYIKADDSDIDDICHALLNPPVYPSLGEYGDLCKIEAVDIVELKELDKPISALLDMQSYIPVNKGNFAGTIYRINNKYEIIKGLRRFQKVPCYLVDKGQEVVSNLFDDDTSNDYLYELEEMTYEEAEEKTEEVMNQFDDDIIKYIQDFDKKYNTHFTPALAGRMKGYEF